MRDGDFSEKRVYLCESCDRWFCDKHLKPRLIFIRGAGNGYFPPESIPAFEEEWNRENSHPDFQYSKKRLEELQIDEERRRELITEALDSMNAHWSRKGYVGRSEERTMENRVSEEELARKVGIVAEESEEDVRDQRRVQKRKAQRETSSPKPWKKLLAAGLALVIVGALLYNLPALSLIILGSHQPPKLSSSSSSNSTSSSSGSNSTLPASSTYAELVNYTLGIINSDRTSNGLSAVKLSSVDSAQVHADDMLRNNYFSHWGTDGSKPYMRYTLAGGRGAVEENIAAYTQGAPSDVKADIRDLENSMMNNDAASNWGHRDNILDPLHNEASIGISYGSGRLYFVEDFINDYVQWSTFTVSQNQASLAGTLSEQMTVTQVVIFYDPMPSNLTSTELGSPPYDGAYTQGTLVGMALRPNYQSMEGITITASTWTQQGLAFQIEFDMTQAFNTYGKGVYTLYLQTSSQDSLTSYSIWQN